MYQKSVDVTDFVYTKSTLSWQRPVICLLDPPKDVEFRFYSMFHGPQGSSSLEPGLELLNDWKEAKSFNLLFFRFINSEKLICKLISWNKQTLPFKTF